MLLLLVDDLLLVDHQVGGHPLLQDDEVFPQLQDLPEVNRGISGSRSRTS
jgi:hypothetical protein